MKHWKKGICCLLALILSLTMSLSWVSAEILYGETPTQLDAIDGTAALLVDLDTGDVLYEQNSTDKAYPASCTKIMTCLLTIEAIEAGELSPDQMITVDESHSNGLTADSSTANLATGEEISLENVLYCLMLASANEAANILAVTVSGSISAFVDLMNTRAEELGCQGTHFCNPHGLHDAEHYTTAQDLVIITQEAWKHDLFRTLVGTASYVVPATNVSAERSLYNSNLLLPDRNTEYAYEYAVGVKTGTTNAAGNCLVSAAEKDGRTLIAVVLGAKKIDNGDGTYTRKVYTESKRLLEYGFDAFQDVTVATYQDVVSSIPVSGGEDGACVSVVPVEDVTVGLVNGLTASDFEQEIDLPEDLTAPIAQGQVLGTLTITYQDQVYATVDLMAQEAVSAAVTESEATPTLEPDQISDNAGTIQSLDLRLVLAVAIGMVLLVVLLSIIIHHKRQYRGRRVR